MKIKTIEIAGIASAMNALRLPYNKETTSNIATYNTLNDDCGFKLFDSRSALSISPKDIRLMQTLIQRGDEHAKPMRGIVAYADIEAPIHFWVEAETYVAGHQRLFSGSTMHTEGRGLSGHALDEAIRAIPYDRNVRKIDFFSYQCLRNIVCQRHNHRKVEWHWFIEWVRSLPFAEELILIGLDEQMKVHDEYLRKYNANEI